MCSTQRFLDVSWKFYGFARGEVCVLGMEHFSTTRTFGAFWLSGGRIVGAFLEVSTLLYRFCQRCAAFFLGEVRGLVTYCKQSRWKSHPRGTKTFEEFPPRPAIQGAVTSVYKNYVGIFGCSRLPRRCITAVTGMLY